MSNVVTNIPQHLLTIEEVEIKPYKPKESSNVPDVDSLTPKQREVYDYILQYLEGKLEDKNVKMISLKGYAGTGKAQPLSATIMTPLGPVKMGSLKIGQYVSTPDGHYAKVNGIFPQGLKSTYRIDFSDGTSTECCNEHLWKVFTEANRNCERVSKIKGRNKLHSSILKTEDMINSIFSQRGSLNYRVPVSKATIFTTKYEPLMIHPYLMGLLLGDGGLTQRLTFSTADKFIVEKANEYIDQNKYYIKKDKNDPYGYVIKSNTSKKGTNHYYSFLKMFGLTCKSEFKYIPNEYLYSSTEDRISLLQGLMDTDGTVNKKGTDITFSSSSKRLTNDFATLVRSLGCIATITEKPTNSLLSYTVRINQNNAFDIFTLPRKKNRVIPKTKYKLCKYITGITFIGEKEQQCISIDHPEHLYITDDFIVTHNTYLITQVLKYFVMMMQDNIAITAPTNKAVKVLRNSANFEHRLISYLTIHKLYGLKEKVNEMTGKITFEPDFKEGDVPEVDQMSALVLDETSMLPDDLFGYINKSNKELRSDNKEDYLKTVFLGDPIQIPPVGKSDCIPFNSNNEATYGIKTLELTEIIRQKEGNPILELATTVRENYKSSYLSYERESKWNSIGSTIFINKSDKEELFNLCDIYFSSTRFSNDSDFVKVIAWKNKTVDFMNDRIRKYIYKEKYKELQEQAVDAELANAPEELRPNVDIEKIKKSIVLPRILIGEKLIADSPIFEDLGYKKRIMFNTNDEFEIISYTMATTVLFQNFEVSTYIAKVSYFDVASNKFKQETISIVHENSIDTYNKVLEVLKANALKAPKHEKGQQWKFFFNMRDKFAAVKYNYAITGHKSQGSTYENAIVIATDIYSNPKIEERNRIAYVAFTRAKTNLFIVE